MSIRRGFAHCCGAAVSANGKSGGVRLLREPVDRSQRHAKCTVCLW